MENAYRYVLRGFRFIRTAADEEIAVRDHDGQVRLSVAIAEADRAYEGEDSGGHEGSAEWKDKWQDEWSCVGCRGMRFMTGLSICGMSIMA